MRAQALKDQPANMPDATDNTQWPEHNENEDGPALSLAGLQFFIADVSRNTFVWHEIGSQSFESKVTDLQEASSREALRLLAPQDRKSILQLIQGAIRSGKAGPHDVGGGADHRVPGVPLMAFRYQGEDGKPLVIGFPSIGEEAGNPGQIVLGLAPILQHFVSSSDRIVLLVDNFGYIRFASDGFAKHFKTGDARRVLGRNISHVQQRLGRTIVSLILASLTRRASATGRGNFLLADNSAQELNYDAMYFRIGGTVGGVLFSADLGGSSLDYARLYDICSASIVVVDTDSRMLLAANKSARKAYHVEGEAVYQRPVTETLLHPKTYAALLDAARRGDDTPQSVVVNSLNGQSKKKRIRASLLDRDTRNPKLVLEARS